MDRSQIGDRFKDYESVAQTTLPRRSWTVIRLDGKAFHTWTRGLERPYSQVLADMMDQTALELCQQVSGTVFAYVQSDEISLILSPGGQRTQPWFDGNVQKIASVTASIAAAHFNHACSYWLPKGHGLAYFDSRVFTVPDVAEAANYLIWRQRDAVRNSISMAAQAHFPHKSLMGLTGGQMQERLFAEAGVNWNDYPDRFKRGGMAHRQQAIGGAVFTRRDTGETQSTVIERTVWRTTGAEHFTHEATVALLSGPPAPMEELADVVTPGGSDG